ncbi:Phosphatidylinositolglycan class N-domain-containing protein [Globomyces pollinis-pini]|nr:Phosphatidylinositolglycan class N-domain-containing protein [Globomyces pollinis-pini]
MTPVLPPSPPAKRLLLAVADGLRADKIYEDDMKRAPFLRQKVTSLGRWGVSHTHVPTESRPGHVALIAGFYEDVSAVTKGWQTNPVNFDSVFNQSRHTWSYGSPDILPMFSYGAADPSSVEMFMYEADGEDFAKDDASDLDTWVFNEFELLFDNAKKNKTLHDLLHSDQIVFFLHLLGIDTNGHGHRPYSTQYLSNINIVDEGLRKVEQMMEDFYGADGKTAYVVTADHGMSNRGSHGDGDPQNTETPLICWGAGIAKPNQTHPTGHDSISRDWGLEKYQRNDVEQADVAPLMSSLIGVPFPVNSVGKLPIDFLDNTEEYKAEAKFANAKEILAQYILKSELKEKSEIMFQPFKPLVNYTSRLSEIKSLIDEKDYDLAERKSDLLVDLAIEGLRYYQTYDWLLLRTIVSFGYFGWIVFSSVFIIKTYSLNEAPFNTSVTTRVVSAILFSILGFFLHSKDSPISYYAYSIFPIFFWSRIAQDYSFIKTLVSNTFSGKNFSTFIHTLLYIFTLEVLVLSYFYRELLTICLLFIGLIWPMTLNKEFCERHCSILRTWRLVTVVTSVFTLLPVELEENIILVIFGGSLIVITGILAVIVVPRYINAALPLAEKRVSLVQSSGLMDIVWLQLFIIMASLLIMFDTSRSLAAKNGLPPLNAILSWMILASCFIIPIFDRFSEKEHYLKRLVIVYLAFAPVFTLLSVSFETLFYICYSLTIFVWMLIEQQVYFFENKAYNGYTYMDITTRDTNQHIRSLKTGDMRIASFFLLFINVGFFGTGNMASISSFTIESVYRFTTIFDPFLMGSLVILKILIPFFLLSSVLSLLSRSLELPPFSLFLLVLSTTDIMTLNFFFLVKDSGSWLEIGTTISHFCIASAFIVFQILLFSAGHFLVGGVLIPAKMKVKSH